MTLQKKQTQTLIDGLSLFPLYDLDHRHTGSYRIGIPGRSIEITTPAERATVIALRDGGNPYASVDSSDHLEVNNLLSKLKNLNFLNDSTSSLLIPHRYLDQIGERDVAAQQLRDRAAPEIIGPQWIDGNCDRGLTTLNNRQGFAVELSGRSRVITLLHSILLSSGVAQITFADNEEEKLVSHTDLGVSSLRARDIGSNFYALAEEKRREIALFPTSRNKARDTESKSPALTIHDGPVDPELLAEWMSLKRPHLVIHSPIANQCAIGPLVIPSATPCLRCLQLFEIDNFSTTSADRIALTSVRELPMHLAHTIAGVVASIALNFIDQSSDEIERNRDLLLGEVLSYSFHRSNQPQAVAIARHPLCGCRQ